MKFAFKSVFLRSVSLLIAAALILCILCLASCSDKNPPDDKETHFSELKYVAFGDSITYGDDATPNHAQMDKPYPAAVKELLSLKEASNQGLNGATLVNANEGACRTLTILSYNENADIISVLLGVNDYQQSLPLGTLSDSTTSTIYGSLNLIAKHLTKEYTSAFIFFMTPYKATPNGKDCTEPNAAGYTLADVANAIKEVAEKYNIPVLDLYNKGNFESEMYNEDSDGLHPSQEFIITHTAPQIAEFIKENYK